MADESARRQDGESASEGTSRRAVGASGDVENALSLADVMIGPLPPERWREYRGLRLEALRSAPDAFSSTFAETERYADDYWERRLRDPDVVFRFARRDDRLIGLAGALCDQNPAAIVSVYVTRDERGMGVGGRLMDAVLDAIAARPGIDAVRLWVSETRPAAIALYRRLGFQPIDREIGAVVTGDGVYDEIIMEKRLR